MVAQNYDTEFQTLRENKEVIADIDRFRNSFDRKPDKSLTFTMTMSAAAHMSMMGNNSGQHQMMGGGMMNNSEMMMNDNDPIEWEDTMAMMNAQSTTDSIKWKMVDDETKKENDKVDNWKFTVGDQVKIKIYNDPNSMHPMQHPFHLHGQRFLVLSENGIKNDNLVWKDTVLVPKGATIEILVDMQNPGKWMAHCHIAEHLSSGMMLPFEVIRP